MTTPSQRDNDLKVDAEAVEDLDVTNDDADNIAGGTVLNVKLGRNP